MGKMKELDMERQRIRHEVRSFVVISSAFLIISSVLAALIGVDSGSEWLVYFSESLMYLACATFLSFVLFLVGDVALTAWDWWAYRYLLPPYTRPKDWLDDVELEDL